MREFFFDIVKMHSNTEGVQKSELKCRIVGVKC